MPRLESTILRVGWIDYRSQDNHAGVTYARSESLDLGSCKYVLGKRSVRSREVTVHQMFVIP